MVPQKVPEPALEKVGHGKKYCYRYRKNIVPAPEDSREFGNGTGEFPGIFHFRWYRYRHRKKYWHRLLKKLVPEKITGTGIRKNSGYRHTLQDKDNDGGDSGTSYL